MLYTENELNLIDIVEYHDFPQYFEKNYLEKISKQIRIKHPKFKLMTFNTAKNFLTKKESGNFVLRPCVQNNEILNVTWKFAKGVIGNIKLEIEDLGLKKVYKLKDKVYETLEDFTENYIRLVNIRHLRAFQHSKFVDGRFDYISNQL